MLVKNCKFIRLYLFLILLGYLYLYNYMYFFIQECNFYSNKFEIILCEKKIVILGDFNELNKMLYILFYCNLIKQGDICIYVGVCNMISLINCDRIDFLNFIEFRGIFFYFIVGVVQVGWL